MNILNNSNDGIASIACLKPYILEAGKIARIGQSKVSREYKEDASILTQIDQKLDMFLSEKF